MSLTNNSNFDLPVYMKVSTPNTNRFSHYNDEIKQLFMADEYYPLHGFSKENSIYEPRLIGLWLNNDYEMFDIYHSKIDPSRTSLTLLSKILTTKGEYLKSYLANLPTYLGLNSSSSITSKYQTTDDGDFGVHSLAHRDNILQFKCQSNLSNTIYLCDGKDFKINEFPTDLYFTINREGLAGLYNGGPVNVPNTGSSVKISHRIKYKVLENGVTYDSDKIPLVRKVVLSDGSIDENGAIPANFWDGILNGKVYHARLKDVGMENGNFNDKQVYQIVDNESGGGGTTTINNTVDPTITGWQEVLQNRASVTGTDGFTFRYHIHPANNQPNMATCNVSTITGSNGGQLNTMFTGRSQKLKRAYLRCVAGAINGSQVANMSTFIRMKIWYVYANGQTLAHTIDLEIISGTVATANNLSGNLLVAKWEDSDGLALHNDTQYGVTFEPSNNSSMLNSIKNFTLKLEGRRYLD